jgi:transposase
MNHRRLAGIDLGVATAHTVRVLDGGGNVVAKRKAWPAVESLTAVEEAALAGCLEETRLEVVIEPAGPAWLPIAVFFCARGHRVFGVSSHKAADLRRFLSRHAKSNGIDADTLARLPLFDPAGLRPLVLPGAERAALDRRVRATDRLTRAAAEHKTRIKDLARQLLPASPLTGGLGAADLTVLERYADPRALLRLGAARLTALIAKASHNHQGAERARQWLHAARASLELYRGHPAAGFTGLAAEIATEVRLPRATCAELATHAAERETRYRQVDPAALARSLPGLAEVGGPALTARMGDPARFATGKRFRSCTGLTPKASETGDTDRKGPAHAQSRLLATAHHPGPRRRHRPQARPPARGQLLPADDRTRQRPPRRTVRRRRQPRRTGLDRHAPRHPLRHPRHRRPPRHHRAGHRDHRRALDRAPRDPRPPAQQEDGEGPPENPRRTIRTGQPPPPHHLIAPQTLRQAALLTSDPP